MAFTGYANDFHFERTTDLRHSAKNRLDNTKDHENFGELNGCGVAKLSVLKISTSFFQLPHDEAGLTKKKTKKSHP